MDQVGKHKKVTSLKMKNYTLSTLALKF